MLEPPTGKPLYEREKLPAGANFTSSPWAYNGRIFCLNEDGTTFVVRAGEQFEGKKSRFVNANATSNVVERYSRLRARRGRICSALGKVDCRWKLSFIFHNWPPRSWA